MLILNATSEDKKYTLRVYPDNNPLSPRHDCTNLGTINCFHSRYDLSDNDNYNYNQKDAFIFSLLEEAIGDTDKAEEFMKDMPINRIDFRNYKDYHEAVDNYAFNKIEEKFLILPIYMYDHSGITISTSPFSCQWDSGQVGWIYVSHQDIIKEYKELTEETLSKAKEALIAEVKIYDHYLCDECYYYTLYKYNGDDEEDTVEENIGTFFGDMNDVKKQIKDSLAEEYKYLVDLLEEQEEEE